MNDAERIRRDYPDTKPPGRPISRAYAKLALALVGRAFALAYKIDPDVKAELSSLPPLSTFGLRIHPSGPSAGLRLSAEGRLVYLGPGPEAPDVLIRFNNMASAISVLSFSASAFEVYANGGLAVSGDLGTSMAIIRALGIVETLLLPGFIARSVLKRPHRMGSGRKAGERIRLYLGLPFALPSKE
jgi:hypothetical protein